MCIYHIEVLHVSYPKMYNSIKMQKFATIAHIKEIDVLKMAGMQTKLL